MYGNGSAGSVEIDGTRLAYRRLGSGPETLVLLHGYIGSHRTWRHLMEPLSDQASVVALDWFGWGESGRSPGLDWSYPAEVERLGRVLDALGIDACNVAGHDYGGFLGLGFCELYPWRVRRLAILNSRAHGTFTARWYVFFGALGCWARTPGVGALLERLPLERIHRRLLRKGIRSGLFDETTVDSYLGWMSNDPQGPAFFRRFHSGYSVRARSELSAGLEAVGCPTTIIWGERDSYLDVRIARELAARISHAELRLVSPAGHFVTEQAPDEVAAALAEWLRRPVG